MRGRHIDVDSVYIVGEYGNANNVNIEARRPTR
jgi:hypothetical protein